MKHPESGNFLGGEKLFLVKIISENGSCFKFLELLRNFVSRAAGRSCHGKPDKPQVESLLAACHIIIFYPQLALAR